MFNIFKLLNYLPGSWMTWIIVIFVKFLLSQNAHIFKLAGIFWFIFQPYNTWRKSNSSNFKE